MAIFEVVSEYEDKNITLPERKTKESAGYDFEVAEDTLIPPHEFLVDEIFKYASSFQIEGPQTLEEMAEITKKANARPILVPTGVKCKLDPGTYLELSVRSSSPLKYWLILANGEGIIDGDYYNNSDNEGHIYFQLINLSPLPIILKKGDIIGQGIIKPYLKTEGDTASGERVGGLGSTTAAPDNVSELENE